MQATLTPNLQNLVAPAAATLGAPTTNLHGKRVLLRVDYNYGQADDPAATIQHRLTSTLATLRALLAQGARVGILTHRGRPQGRVVPALSVAPLAPILSKLVGKPVTFVPDCIGRMAEQAMETLAPGQIVLLENTRFHLGEQLNQMPFAQALAKMADLLVNEAFAAAHRTQASTNALATLLPTNLGAQFLQELAWINQWHTAPAPRALLVGGNQVIPKIELIQKLISNLDVLLLGGVVGQTFLAGKDINLQRSALEFGAVEAARNVLAEAGVLGCRVHLPRDFTVQQAPTDAEHTATTQRRPHALQAGETALDIGPLTLETWQRVLLEVPSLIWFGSVGAWEIPGGDGGIRTLAQALLERHQRNQQAFTLLGGNGLLQALAKLNLLPSLQQAGVHLSTGGGALQAALGGQLRGTYSASAPPQQQVA